MNRHLSAKIISIIISCIVIAFALTGCNGGSTSPSVAGIEYYHFDTDSFYASCDKLEGLASTDKSEKIISIYDDLYSDCEELSSLYSVIYIRYSENVGNEYYSDEQIYSSDALRECTDRLCGICRSITEGPSADAFMEHVGEDAFKYFADYDVMNEEEKKLSRRESKLVDRYYKIIHSSKATTVEYENKEWSLDELTGDSGEMFAMSDYDGYSKTYNKLLKKINNETGKIFLQLVAIRDRIAEINGYDNYADLEDAECYNRDYTRQDLEKLYKDVQEISGEYYDSYYTAMSLGQESSFPEMSRKELLENLQKYSGKISKDAGKACDMMIDKELYSIGDDSCRIEGAYTTFIEKANVPFLFDTLDKTRDFAVITHEFGHFTEYNLERTDGAVVANINLDLAEVASTGFEGLMTHYYDQIFGDDSEAAIKYVAGELLENVVDGCIMDQFQREVYDNPDMTLDEINRVYSEVYSLYSSYGCSGYEWVFISHNFELPMYYISYSVSALASLQIWNQSLTDFEGACDKWNQFVQIGTLNRQYMEVIDEVGLQKFTEDGAVQKICRPALKRTRPAA